MGRWTAEGSLPAIASEGGGRTQSKTIGVNGNPENEEPLRLNSEELPKKGIDLQEGDANSETNVRSAKTAGRSKKEENALEGVGKTS